MVKVKDILGYIDSFAPYNTACEWDNTGFSVGDKNADVSKIVFALDITSDVVSFAESVNADLIVTHHPLIFHPVKELPSTSMLYRLAQNGIAHISAHTNFDFAKEGVNTALCNKLNLNITNIVKTADGAFIYKCVPEKEYSLTDFVNYIKEILGGTVRYNCLDKIIHTVAVCAGAGEDYLTEAKEIGADVLLTGDGSHHDFLDANEMSISLISAGHFETENPAIDLMIEKIKNKFNVECIKAPQTTPIVTV